jgi:hypothetical protein
MMSLHRLLVYKENIDRDVGGSVVIKCPKMKLTLSLLRLSSSRLRKNHPWRKSWVLQEKLTSGPKLKWELPVKARASDEVDQLEKSIEGKLGSFVPWKGKTIP